MIPEYEDETRYNINQDLYVARDNYREIKAGRTAFIYNDWVYKTTIELLDKDHIEYKTKKVLENGRLFYYKVEGMKQYGERRNKNKKAKTN